MTAGAATVSLLAACTSTAAQTPTQSGMVTTEASTSIQIDPEIEAHLSLAGGAAVALPAAAVSGPGQLVGAVAKNAPAFAASVQAGPVYDFHLIGTRLTGTAALTLPVPAPEADGPDVALLVYYDASANSWTPVDSRYDPSQHMVSAQVSHLSLWSVLRVSVSWLSKQANAGADLIGQTNTAPTPSCTDSDKLAAAGAAVSINQPDTTMVKACAGLVGGTVQLKIANNRGYAMSVEYPSGWTSSMTSSGPVGDAIAAWVGGKITVSPNGRSTTVLPAGQTITLTKRGTATPRVVVLASGPAYLATALGYAADTLTKVLGGIPGLIAPDPSTLAKMIGSLSSATQCVTQMADLARTTPTDAAGVRSVLQDEYKLAIGCMQDMWNVAYGVAGGVAAFVLGVLDWAITGVLTAISGVAAIIDSIHYINGIVFSAQGPAAAMPTPPAATGFGIAGPVTSHLNAFQTPDGNVACLRQAPARVDCVILDFSYKPPAGLAPAGDGPYANGIQIETEMDVAYGATAETLVGFIGIGDTLVDPATTPHLAVGSVNEVDGIRCKVLTDGMQCAHDDEEGFVLTRTAWRLHSAE